jgi:hypothetical protein
VRGASGFDQTKRLQGPQQSSEFTLDNGPRLTAYLVKALVVEVKVSHAQLRGFQRDQHVSALRIDLQPQGKAVQDALDTNTARPRTTSTALNFHRSAFMNTKYRDNARRGSPGAEAFLAPRGRRFPAVTSAHAHIDSAIWHNSSSKLIAIKGQSDMRYAQSSACPGSPLHSGSASGPHGKAHELPSSSPPIRRRQTASTAQSSGEVSKTWKKNEAYEALPQREKK